MACKVMAELCKKVRFQHESSINPVALSYFLLVSAGGGLTHLPADPEDKIAKDCSCSPLCESDYCRR